MRFALILTSLITLFGCNFLYKWQVEQPDNFVEEAVEEVIESNSGINLDLTPITGSETQDLTMFKE